MKERKERNRGGKGREGGRKNERIKGCTRLDADLTPVPLESCGIFLSHIWLLRNGLAFFALVSWPFFSNEISSTIKR